MISANHCDPCKINDGEDNQLSALPNQHDCQNIPDHKIIGAVGCARICHLMRKSEELIYMSK